VYVTAAKKLVFGEVGIDMLAGPSEVLIVADDPADAEYIILDMKAQQEHDAQAAAKLISLNRVLTKTVKQKYPDIFVVEAHSLASAAALVNDIGPEHTELMTKNNRKLLSLITASGTIFIGKKTPVALGDYIAGPSHILPTGRTARFSSGLSVIDFYTRINTIEYVDPDNDIRNAVRLAEAEGMKQHAASLRRRLYL
jgi:histidinol dehydrogenase